MKLFTVGLLLASAAWAADDTSDDLAKERLAVEKTVLALASFTSDFDGASALAQLTPAKPVLVVSKEPMGEAQIVMPGPGRVILVKTRFLTSDVALVDASAAHPLLFVVKREAGVWKIASLRVLAD
jgi:hypothetical protein